MRSGESAAASWLVSLRTCTGRDYQLDHLFVKLSRASFSLRILLRLTSPQVAVQSKWLGFCDLFAP